MKNIKQESGMGNAILGVGAATDILNRMSGEGLTNKAGIIK